MNARWTDRNGKAVESRTRGPLFLSARPTPNAEDIARATAFVDGALASGCDADWIAQNRAHLIHLAAEAEMQKRLNSRRQPEGFSIERKVA